MKEPLLFAYRFFSSARLAIALMILLCLACTAGTLLDLESGLKFVYHAPWFTALSALFAFNLWLCCLRRILAGARRWGFLVLHAAVLLTLAGGLWGRLSMEKGIMIIGQGESGREFWTDSAQRLPLDPDLKIIVKPGRKVNKGDTVAVASGETVVYDGEATATVINYLDEAGGYIRDNQGRPVLMLRKSAGMLPFEIQLERFWIENHPLPEKPQIKLIAIARGTAEPEVADISPGSRGAAGEFAWRVEKTTETAKLGVKQSGPHRIMVRKKGADPATADVTQGKPARVDSLGLTIVPIKFFENAILEQAESGYVIVEQGGGMRNPAVEIEIAQDNGPKYRKKLFAAMGGMGHSGGPHSAGDDKESLQFFYQAPESSTFVDSETKGSSFAAWVVVEKADASAGGWVTLESEGEPFSPLPGISLFAADMRKPMPRSYKSKVTLLKDGEPALAGIIEVNKPLMFEGYWIYQQDYDHVGMTYTVLEVVRDPGITLSFAGLAMLIAGAALVFYVEPLLRRGKTVRT